MRPLSLAYRRVTKSILREISKALSRIQYPEHTLDTDIMSKQSRDILRLADDKDGYDNIPNNSNRKSIFFKVWGKTSMT